MSNAIPLIRATGVLPWVKWLRREGRPVSDWLLLHNLPPRPEDDPLQAVSYYQSLAFITYAAGQEGPDLGCRVVDDSSVFLLDAIGEAIRTSSTPRMALDRAAAAAPVHYSHSVHLMGTGADDAQMQHNSMMRLVQLVAHQLHQHVAALVLSICRSSGVPEVADIRFGLMPHPGLGLAHLEAYLGPGLVPSFGNQMTAYIPDAVFDAPMHWPVALHTPAEPKPDFTAVGEQSLAASARVLIAGWLKDGPVTMDHLAIAAGRSRRSLQRLLAAEGTSFTALHDEVRRNQAIDMLDGSAAVARIADNLGYAYHSSFTRAVRRWTSESPTKVRRSRHA